MAGLFLEVGWAFATLRVNGDRAMNKKTVGMIVVLTLVLCLSLGLLASQASAQDSDGAKTSDKKLATKGDSASDALADGKDDDEDRDGPTNIQMGLGFGSVIVMIMAVKYL